jgi:hypothetical protein
VDVFGPSVTMVVRFPCFLRGGIMIDVNSDSDNNT